MTQFAKNRKLKKLRYVLEQSLDAYQRRYGEVNRVSLAVDCGLDMRELFDCIGGTSTAINDYQRIVRTLNKATIYHQEVV